MKYIILYLAIICCLLTFTRMDSFGQSQLGNSQTTAEHLEAPGWWPTKGDADGKQFLGNDACRECHEDTVTSQETTAMFHSGMHASQSKVLEAHPTLTFREGQFTTNIVSTPGEVLYSVSDGSQSSKLSAIWAFGSPQRGQTYVLKQENTYYESRLSYFVKLQGLDITVGHSPLLPEDMKAAVGRKLQEREVRLCFGCHTTGSISSGSVAQEKALPGVTCEACHGPGSKHVALIEAPDVKREVASKAILDPARFTPSQSVDFCGACHKTWADVVEMPSVQGAVEVRYQPYRLEQSRCWGTAGDPRLTCVACHDPHKPLVHDPVAYDAKCLACHSKPRAPSALSPTKSVCRTGSSKCVTCHMPKYSVPQIHGVFTDHEIRIVRASGQADENAAR